MLTYLTHYKFHLSFQALALKYSPYTAILIHNEVLNKSVPRLTSQVTQ